MSLVTRCPACATQFKVVRDQLRISDGWVRCGRCSEVFDATTDLHEAADAPVASVSAPEAVPAAAAPEVRREQTAEPEPERDFGETDFFDDEQEIEETAPPEPQSAPEHVQAEPLHSAEPDANAASPTWPESEPIAQPLLAASSQDEGASVATAAPETGESPEGAEAPEAPEAPEATEATEATEEPEALDLSAHWPEAEALLLGQRGSITARPPAPPPLAFPVLDLSLPRTESLSDRAALAGDSRAGAAPGSESEDPVDNSQFAKALRRARAKAAKIAKAKARALKAEAARAPLVLASESEPVALIPTADVLTHFGGSAVDVPPAKRRLPDRPLLIAIALLAALLLVVQVLHQQRDLIAARQPSMRPLLSGLCSMLGCEIAPLRSIDDIKIDGASFTHAQSGDGYLLSFTLRNIARIPLAMPAVELSLLDTQERAVVRRVLQPSEFGAPAVLSPGGERSASLALNLTGPEAAALPPVVGFRVEALYP